VEQYEPRIALALTPSFVADINLQPKSGNPSLSPHLAANSVTIVTPANDVVTVFTADDGQHGMELWMTDGTTAGTQLLKDIWPGKTASAPTDLFESGGYVYFAANDGVYGRELWKTDGTAVGTVLVKNISLPLFAGMVDAAAPSDPAGFAAMADGSVLFAASSDDPVSQIRVRQLWRTDGTEAGTVPLIADNTSIALNPTELTSFGTHVLFRADDEFGSSVLWITDGTGANTVPVQTSTFESIVSPRDFTVFEGGAITSPFVIFTADDGAGGRSIWRYDATNGPSFVAQFGVTLGAGSITEMVRFGNVAFFVGDNGNGSGPQLWTTTGANGGTAAFEAYVSPSFVPVTNPARLTVADTTLFFIADGLPGETSLWTSDGSEYGTFRLGSSLSGVDGLVARGSDVFFVNFDGQSRELWKSDGISLGIVREINPTGDAILQGFNAVAFNGGLLFAADDGVHGTELWKSDGTAAGTVLLKDINPESGDGIDAFSGGSGSYISAAVIGNAFYFAADDGVHGTELWKREGDSAPVLVADLEPGDVGSRPAQFTVVGSRLYFTTSVMTAGTTYSLWVLDSALPAGPLRLSNDVLSSELANDLVKTFHYLAPIGGNVLFAANDVATGVEVWITDGTSVGTQRLKDINPATGAGSFPSGFAAVGSGVVFSADNGVNGRELWITDGTSVGTKLLKDIVPGAASSGPQQITSVGAVAYFSADDGSNGWEPWITDGTAAGTRLVKNINAGTGPVNGPSITFPPNSNPFGFTALGSFVLFSADDGKHGTELWRTDGTDAGTTLVKDINTIIAPDSGGGVGGSYPIRLTEVGGKVFFAAEDGVTAGGGLWATDGTAAGTVAVPLAGLVDASPNVGNLVAAGGRLFFTAEKNSQRVLLETDGTLPGTATIELGPGYPTGFAGFNAAALASDGRRLYFAVDDAVHGKELWELPLDVVAPTVTITSDLSALGLGQAAVVTFVLSEPSPNFGINAVTVAGGKCVSFTGSGTTYSATFVPRGGFVGTATIEVAAGAFTDAAGNPNDGPADALIDVSAIPLSIDNGRGTTTVGFFSMGVGVAGSVIHSGVTALGRSGQTFVSENVIFDYLIYVMIGSGGTTLRLDETTVTMVPALVSPGVVASEGQFSGENGVIHWRVESSFIGDADRFTNRITFESADPLGSLRVIAYLDEDVRGPGGDILRVVGTPGAADFRAFTLDEAERVGFAQSGELLSGPGLVNATYRGWAADAYASLQEAIAAGVATYSIAGDIQPVRLPAFTDPGLGRVYGPADVTTAFAWDVNPAATTAVVVPHLTLTATAVGGVRTVIAVGTDGRSTTWNREFSYAVVNPTTIRINGLTAIQSGFFSANVPLTITPTGGLANVAAKVLAGRYDTRSRSVVVTLATAIPATPTTGTLIVGQSVQPGARLIDTTTGSVVRAIKTEDLETAGYSAAFATRFQGGLRVAAADTDGNGYGDLAVAPGGVPDQADPTQPGRKLAAIFAGSSSRVAIFDGTPTPSWQPVSIDVGGVFGAEGAGGYLVALGDVRSDATGSGVRELIVAAGRKVAVFDVLVASKGDRPVINPVPVQVVTLPSGTIASLGVGRLLGGSFDEIIVAANTAKGLTAGTTTVSLLDGTTLGTLRSFTVTARVESGPSRNLVDIFGFGTQLATGDFDGNSKNDLALGAGANGLGNFRVIGGEFIASTLWLTDRTTYQAAIAQQLGDRGNFSQVRPTVGSRWQPRVGPDFFSPLVPKEPLGGGFNAPVSVVAVPDGNGRAKLFAALGSTSQSGNVVKRFAFLGAADRWVNDGTFEMRPQSPGKPELRASVGLRLG
jgi:ELWxxDGT repeat protein